MQGKPGTTTQPLFGTWVTSPFLSQKGSGEQPPLVTALGVTGHLQARTGVLFTSQRWNQGRFAPTPTHPTSTRTRVICAVTRHAQCQRQVCAAGQRDERVWLQSVADPGLCKPVLPFQTCWVCYECLYPAAANTDEIIRAKTWSAAGEQCSALPGAVMCLELLFPQNQEGLLHMC